jgi:hypothetical protein
MNPPPRNTHGSTIDLDLALGLLEIARRAREKAGR